MVAVDIFRCDWSNDRFRTANEQEGCSQIRGGTIINTVHV